MTKPKLRSAAPIFQVADVDATIRWYAANLGFEGDGFPKSPPYVFGILSRDSVEIMIQRIDDAAPLDTYRRREGGVWHVYLRVSGVRELYDAVREKPDVVMLEPLKRQPYGDSEFVVRDPNGYVLVFSERLD